MRDFGYNEPDFAFGQTMLKLRTAISITQAAVAEYLGVSRRSVGDWEMGNSYPKADNLKKFIELAFAHNAFEVGQEATEIRLLWREAHQKSLFDENWLARLLTTNNVDATGKNNFAAVGLPAINPLLKGSKQLYWDDAPSVPNFYGREAEIEQLQKLIVADNCRVVGVVGFGGIGKTALAVNLMHQIADHFEVVIWRSLSDNSSFEAFLDDCLEILSPELLNSTPIRRPGLLLKQLQARRVLLVLDNLETLLDPCYNRDNVRPINQAWERFLQLLAETNHQSCLLFTSREKPACLMPFEGSNAALRTLRLTPLASEACEKLLIDKNVGGTASDRAHLIEIFGGNPLALKIVAQTIVDLFEGDVRAFLVQGEIIFGGVRTLIEEQLNRLSAAEQNVLMKLATMAEGATLDKLVALPSQSLPRTQLLEAVTSLYRRSLIERGEKPSAFTLHPVVRQYATTLMVEATGSEPRPNNLKHLINYRHELVTTSGYKTALA